MKYIFVTKGFLQHIQHLSLLQNTKRVLRSNEILLPPNGALDTELDLSFSLQVCRNCNSNTLNYNNWRCQNWSLQNKNLQIFYSYFYPFFFCLFFVLFLQSQLRCSYHMYGICKPFNVLIFLNTISKALQNNSLSKRKYCMLLQNQTTGHHWDLTNRFLIWKNIYFP